MIRYQVAPDSTLSLRGEFFPPGAFVPPSKVSQQELKQLIREGTLLVCEKRATKSAGKRRRSAVTRFNLNPEELAELSLDVLRILVQERGVKPPATSEDCIALLSKDYLGG